MRLGYDVEEIPKQTHLKNTYSNFFIIHVSQDKGAFALAQALKANEGIAVTSLNLGNNSFTKYGEVRSFWDYFEIILCLFLHSHDGYHFSVSLTYFLAPRQVALTDARDHVYEMTEREINIFF
jgi:NLR family CARD domain-containing protein 3